MFELTEGMRDVMEQQGWNEDTMLCLAVQFIKQHKLDDEFEAFLDDRADKENEEAGDF